MALSMDMVLALAMEMALSMDMTLALALEMALSMDKGMGNGAHTDQ